MIDFKFFFVIIAKETNIPDPWTRLTILTHSIRIESLLIPT